MTKFEVCTWDYGSGITHIDHTWSMARHHGKRKTAKLLKRVRRWANKAATADNSTDHAVYVREV